MKHFVVSGRSAVSIMLAPFRVISTMMHGKPRPATMNRPGSHGQALRAASKRLFASCLPRHGHTILLHAPSITRIVEQDLASKHSRKKPLKSTVPQRSV